MKRVIVLLLIGILSTATPASAVRLLPRHTGTKPASTAAKKTTSSSIGVSPKLMSGKTGLRVAFSNLTLANSVSYTLSYETNGKPEGVVGSVSVGKGSDTRELLFGTCSSGTCRYHKGLKNMTFTVTSSLKSGKKSIKRFRIRV